MPEMYRETEDDRVSQYRFGSPESWKEARYAEKARRASRQRGQSMSSGHHHLQNATTRSHMALRQYDPLNQQASVLLTETKSLPLYSLPWGISNIANIFKLIIKPVILVLFFLIVYNIILRTELRPVGVLQHTTWPALKHYCDIHPDSDNIRALELCPHMFEPIRSLSNITRIQGVTVFGEDRTIQAKMLASNAHKVYELEGSITNRSNITNRKWLADGQKLLGERYKIVARWMDQYTAAYISAIHVQLSRFSELEDAIQKEQGRNEVARQLFESWYSQSPEQIVFALVEGEKRRTKLLFIHFRVMGDSLREAFPRLSPRMDKQLLVLNVSISYAHNGKRSGQPIWCREWGRFCPALDKSTLKDISILEDLKEADTMLQLSALQANANLTRIVIQNRQGHIALLTPPNNDDQNQLSKDINTIRYFKEILQLILDLIIKELLIKDN